MLTTDFIRLIFDIFSDFSDFSVSSEQIFVRAWFLIGATVQTPVSKKPNLREENSPVEEPLPLLLESSLESDEPDPDPDDDSEDEDPFVDLSPLPVEPKVTTLWFLFSMPLFLRPLSS